MKTSLLLALSLAGVLASPKMHFQGVRNAHINSWQSVPMDPSFDRPAVARSPPKTDYLRPCYFTNWAQYRQGRGKYMPEDYIPGLCTHILFAFGWMNDDYTVRAFDPADLPNDWAGEGMFKRINALKKKDPGLKTLLSIGGWSFGTRLFKEMSQTPERRKKFIDSAVAFVRQWDFDGIDIDWEYPEAVDMQNYVATMTELRTATEEEATRSGKARLLVTAAVSAGEATLEAGYDVPALSSAFDFILLMNYDFHGAWSDELGANSPLYARSDLVDWQKVWNIDWAANRWHVKGMPKEKIVIGMATYGRGWTLKDPAQIAPGTPGNRPAKSTQFVQEAGVTSYYEICEMLAQGAKRYWDSEQQVPYLVLGDQWFSYDDMESIKNKLAYVKRQEFGGAFVWTLDFDDFNAKCPGSDQPYPLMSVIAKELGGITIAKVAVTSPPVVPPPVVPSVPAPVPSVPAPPHLPQPTTGAPTGVLPPYATTAAPQLARLCDGQPDGFQRMEKRCDQFLLCLGGASFAMSCPAGLHFSTARGYCTKPAESGCSVVEVIPTTRKSPTEPVTTAPPAPPAVGVPVCTADGFFPDPSNCEKFIRCVSGQAFAFDCPRGLSFNKFTMQCDHPNPENCA